MEKLNLAQAISLLESEQNFGSIYSKQDVINLLNRIEENVPHGTFDIEEIIEDIENEIDSIIDNMDNEEMIEMDSAEFRLDGNQIELCSVGLNTYNLRDSFSRIGRDIKHKFEERQTEENED